MLLLEYAKQKLIFYKKLRTCFGYPALKPHMGSTETQSMVERNRAFLVLHLSLIRQQLASKNEPENTIFMLYS